MEGKKFTVIQGGALEEHKPIKRIFISAYVTDTRLMGAVVLYLHWKVSGQHVHDLHQFFYYDPEDEGIETYKSLASNDLAAIKSIENTLLGGLGSNRISLTEAESRFLFCHYSKTNIKNNKALPDDESDYDFLLDENAFSQMTEKSKINIILKTCTKILSDNHAINYFLMRAFALDKEGAMFLAYKSCKLTDFFKGRKFDLCKNTIEVFKGETEDSYLCESLLEDDNQYRIAVSEIVMGKSFKVKSAKLLSSFMVSSAEAAMLMAKAEYVTCYDIIDCDSTSPDGKPTKFMEGFYKFVQGSMATEHEDGSLFIVFNNNNMHVNRSEFRLNDDLYCIYYVSSFDQLLVTTYSPHVITVLEGTLEQSEAGKYLLPLSKYQFKEPMVYEFIQSDFEDFEEFVEAMLFSDKDE